MLQSRVSRCISAVGDCICPLTACWWTPPKTEVLWCTSGRPHASAANSPSGSWQSHRATCQRSPESWHLCRCWPLNAHTRQQHPRGMLCLVLSLLPHQCFSSEVDSRVKTELYSRVHTSNFTEFVSASLWLNMYAPWSKSLWIYVTLMTILILTN